MEEEVSVLSSTVAWSWVVEALAKSPVVDTTIIYGLVSRSPPLLGESGKEAREAVALRCLEGMLCPNMSSNHIVSDHSKIEIDPAGSCEATLQCIWSETSGSKGALDELKWDVQSFVEQKKASMPKSTLELLKDVSLEGTHPLAASVKEISESAVAADGGQCVLNVPFDDGDPSSPPLRSDEDDHGDKTMLAEDNGSSSRSGIDGQRVQANLLNGISLPCMSGISGHYADSHVQEIDAASHGMNNQCPPGKKLKLDKVYGMQSNLHSAPDGSNHMCNGTENGQYHEVIKSNGIHDEKSYGKAVDEQAKMFTENHDQPQISPNHNDHCHEEVNLTMKNPIFLNSQGAFTRDTLTMTETEPNLCMKCNKDGQLLSCSASNCSLLFHESCLPCSASFDDQGSFYCPFCAYSRAMSEYARAKEKVSLARKELSVFIGGRTGDQTKHDSNTSSGDDVHQDRHRNVDKTAKVNKGDNVVTQVAKPRQSRRLKGKQVEMSRSSAFMDANGFVAGTQQHLPYQDRQGAEIIIRLSRGPYDGGKFSGVDEQIMNVKRKRATTGCKITELHGDDSTESISDSDGVLADKRNDGTSYLASPKPLCAIPGTPRSRRKKVPWTPEEEEMLKKAVEKFPKEDNQAFAWKDILEFGSSVFHHGRTPVDLKDKWRNMTRGTSPKTR